MALLLTNAAFIIMLIHVCGSKGCNTGWFGEKCQYKCQCIDEKCDVNGSCSDNVKCKPGWFGPLCQYQNLLDLNNVSISDSNVKSSRGDNKCSKNSTSSTLEIVLQDRYFLSWIRFVVNERAMTAFDATNIIITFKRNQNDTTNTKCVNLKTYLQRDKKFIDVVCDLTDTFSVINITGDIVRNICAIQVSGGRNVALHQFAKQSSNYTDDNYGLNDTHASNAVDGNTGSFEQKTCTHTVKEDKSPNWNLTFAHPQVVHSYILYNREVHKTRLNNFRLQSSTSDWKVIFNYTGPDIPQDTYLITTMPPYKPITYIQIFGGDEKENILTLCEVEAFGDSSCSGNAFGLECNRSCNCEDKAEKCFIATGGCVSGCASGFYGEACSDKCPFDKWGVDCLQSCNSHCLNETCHGYNGSCRLGCIPGYHGHDCSQFLEESQALAISLVVALAICLIVIFTIVYIFWKRRAKKGVKKILEKNDKFLQISDGKKMKKNSLSRSLSAEHSESAISKSVSENSVAYVNKVTLPRDLAIEVKDLQQFLRSHDTNYFLEQFKNIPQPKDVSMTVGQSPENRQKNRYKDICTYDHSRVHLEINTVKNEGDYINASYIEGFKHEEKLIASQGPNTIILNDFVRMLWEQKVEKVVMLTNLIEDGKIKCERYWPDDDDKVFGSIKIRLTTTKIFADYVIRRLELSKEGNPTQYIQHFHFTSWPDKGVPATPWSLVDFEERVFIEPTLKPIVVHCSAGVGRTGTFIALHLVMKEAQDTGRVDFFQTVSKLRQARVMMIQTSEQYEFLHRAALVALTFLGTTITAGDIVGITEKLQAKTVTGRTLLEKQFQDVCTVSEDAREDEPDGNHDDDTIYQNAANSVEPHEKSAVAKLGARYRVRLTSLPDGSAGDTINAVFVSSFTKKENFILTHIPWSAGVVDFWTLAILYDVSVIILLDESKEQKTSHLPTRIEDTLDCSPFLIKTKPINSSDLWEEIEVKVKVPKNKSSKLSIDSGSYFFTHIKTNFKDFNPKTILTILKKTREMISSNEGRVIFMCRNGAQYSGLACVLTLLLDRMDYDLCLTVPNVVGAVKSIRPEVIPTLEQYRALYLVLQRYSETTSSYTNFNTASTLPRV